MLVYVASSFANRPAVRAVHETLKQAGITYTSTWADTPGDGEDFADENAAPAAIAKNDGDLVRSDFVLLLATERSGETFCEARMATLLGIPVLWTGRLVLSAYRPGVKRFQDVDEAIEWLKGYEAMKQRCEPGATGK